MGRTEKRDLTSAELVRAAYAMVRQDRALLGLVAIGSVASFVAMALVAVPLSWWTHEPPFPSAGDLVFDGEGWTSLAIYAAALFASTFVWQLCAGAVVAAAVVRVEGGVPTLRGSLAAAWDRRGPLLGWALLSTTIGVLLLAMERFGLVGVVARLLSGIVWGLATMFAVPVMMQEGTGPFRTVARSSRLLLDAFGPNVRSTLRVVLPFTAFGIGLGVLLCAGMGIGAYGVNGGGTVVLAIGLLLVAVAVLGLVALTVLYSAIDLTLSVVLHRWITGQSLPGIDAAHLPVTRQPGPATA